MVEWRGIAPDECPAEEGNRMSTELTPDKLFEIVLEEALRDGKVEESEFEKVEAIKELLGVTAEQHKAAFSRVKERIDKAEPRERSMDRLMIYQKCLIVAAADGTITEDESAHLHVMQSFLDITPEEHKEAIAKVKAWMQKKRQARQTPAG